MDAKWESCDPVLILDPLLYFNLSHRRECTFSAIVSILHIRCLYDCFVLCVWQYNLGLLDARDAELAQYDISSAALEVKFIWIRVLNVG